ncbi:MAG: hypothetical protein JEZ06_12400 [Anaerolineaceae bacterium]|nr:hypothetical protein [Anaerolineaceae bacterium]
MKNKKILIIENEKAIGNLAKFTLKARGVLVEIEFDHRKGFALACNKPPDLFILGHNLPGTNLIQFLKDIRSVDELSESSILVRIDESFKGSQDQLKLFGVKAVLESPFDTTILAETVISLLNEENTKTEE